MTEEHPMVVADPLAAFEREGMVKAFAPAKVNLYLNVGERRADGFHDLTTIMHALTLHDVIHLDRAPAASGEGLQVQVDCFAREGLEPLAIAPEDNIVSRAIRLLAQKIERCEDELISARIEKHIPHEAGLGGGSSDAAAALIGAARLWNLDPAHPAISEAAAELGSDVPFFLRGGCARLSGTGSDFEAALVPMKESVVLIKPQEGVSTPKAYALFDAHPKVAGVNLQQKALSATQAQDVPLYNNLSAAAEQLLPVLSEIKAWLSQQQGVRAQLMSGSGSTVFGVCDSFEAAYRVAGAARLHGWWARSTAFSSARAATIPRSKKPF